jgi:hypothetical protein
MPASPKCCTVEFVDMIKLHSHYDNRKQLISFGINRLAITLFTNVFVFQGRTALWDAILLLCHQINVGYGGVVRGIHIGSSALNLLSVIDSDMES